ncbi:hypothetical protein GCM10010170_059790 [Dactylosporangium salmoneum]|uniref:HEAT repeat domain-containing protein n=2 Tax=Dactylosporangium salmoneum TaxID=53361 RepID=A0ABN3GWM4_9ACTN
MLGYLRVLEARDPATPPDRLRALADDDYRPVRVWTARNFHTPADALERLARDEDDHVRWRATYNLNLPEVAIRWQANGDRKRLGAGYNGWLHDMAHHPGAPVTLRAELLAGGACPQWCRQTEDQGANVDRGDNSRSERNLRTKPPRTIDSHREPGRQQEVRGSSQIR